MTRFVLPLALMLGIQTLLTMSTFVIPVLAPVAGPELGVPPKLVGLFTALIYGCAAVSSLLAARFIAPLGPMRMSQLCLAGAAFGCLCLTIESAAFTGKSRVERQRLVYSALGDLMHERVHALSIRATAPGES